VSEALDLSKVFDRDTVKLSDGTEYEIKNPEEFGILDDHQLNALIKRIETAREKAASEDATEEDAKNASELLRALATLLVIDLPTEAKVGDWESVAIFDFHMKKRVANATKLAEELGIRLPPPGKPRAKKKSPTTVRSSRGSRRSTAGRPKTG
jgi:hypothetical protein